MAGPDAARPTTWPARRSPTARCWPPARSSTGSCRPTFFGDHAMMAWLSLEALRMWAEHGPGRTLVGPAGHIACVTIALRQDYRTGYRVMRRILTVAETRGYEPDTSQARFLYAVITRPLVRAARGGRTRGAARPGGADPRRRPAERVLHLPRLGLRAARLRRRRWTTTSSRSTPAWPSPADRQRTERRVVRVLPAAGTGAARRSPTHPGR